MKRLKQIIKNLLDIIKKPEMKILPGNLAFFLILSVFALLIVLGFIASFFDISMASVIKAIESSLPEEVSDILIPLINGKDIDVNIFIFTVIGMVMASNGAYAMILISNTLYKTVKTDELKDRIKSVFITILLVGIILFIVVVLGYGTYIVNWLLNLKIVASFKNEIYYTFLIIKWPLAFLIIFFNVKLLYTLAPDKSIKSKTTTRGAIFTTLGWFLVTTIYSYYVSNIVDYNLFYGTLSNIIVLMIWLYLMSYIFVIGIAINSEQYNNILENENTKEEIH